MTRKKTLLLLLSVVVLFVLWRVFTTEPNQFPKPLNYRPSESSYDLGLKDIKVGSISIDQASSLKRGEIAYQSRRVMAQRLGFTATTNEQSLWNSGSKRLQIYDSQSFEYQDSASPGEITLPDQGAVEKRALDFVTGLEVFGPEISLKVASVDLVKSKDDVHLHESEKDVVFAEAQLIIVYLKSEIDGRPLYYSLRGQNEHSVWLDKSGQIVRFDGPMPLQLRNLTDTSVKNSQTALNEIEFQKGVLAYLIEGTSFTPQYVFTGEAKNADNKNLSLLVFLTAVPD
jgi:hypothetical protein